MRFEQLEVWQRSFALSTQVYLQFRQLRDFGFKDQICRSALSVPSNIAEGTERVTEREKARYLSMAKGSCGELKTQLMIGIEIGYLEQEVGEQWKREVEIISKMLGALMRTIQSSENYK